MTGTQEQDAFGREVSTTGSTSIPFGYHGSDGYRIPQGLLFMRLPMKILILLDLGMGAATAGVHCLVCWLSHTSIDWRDTAIDAVVIGLTFFIVHICLRAFFKKRRDATSSAE